MDNLLAGLSLMFFELEIVNKENNTNPVLVFSVACSIVGGFAVLLDMVFYYLRGASLLSLKHGVQSFIFLLAWAVGALLIGWLGQMAKVFAVSVSAAVLIGFTWPIMFTKYVKEQAKKEASEEPEQPVEEEI